MSNKFVPVGEVADRLSVSIHTVRQWLRKGIIPSDLYMKIGNTYRYDLQGIEKAFLSTNKESPNETAVVESVVSAFDVDEDF